MNVCWKKSGKFGSAFEKYRIVQDRLFESDFDRMLKQIDLNIPQNQRESAESVDKDEAES